MPKTTPQTKARATGPAGAAPAPSRGPGRPRTERPSGVPLPVEGRTTAAKLTTTEFAKSVVRLRAARLMLAGPITAKALYGSKIGKRAAITTVVIAPWFTIQNGLFKLTAVGRDEYVEAMDGPAPGSDPNADPTAPVKTGRQLLAEREAASPPATVEGKRPATARRVAGLPVDLFD